MGRLLSPLPKLKYSLEGKKKKKKKKMKALQADGLVAQKKEVKPAVQMRNSVDTYYRNVLPTSYSSSYTFNRLRSKPLLRAKPMVKLAPKKMGSTYFNTFMAVP